MCIECDHLRREVRELKEELAEYRRDDGNDDRVMTLRSRLRVRPQTARVLDALLDSPGRLMTFDTLIERAGIGGDADDDLAPSRRGPLHSIRINVCRARTALSDRGIRNAIANVHGEGYVISKDAAAMVGEVIGG